MMKLQPWLALALICFVASSCSRTGPDLSQDQTPRPGSLSHQQATRLCQSYFGEDLIDCGRPLYWPPPDPQRACTATVKTGAGSYQVLFALNETWRITNVRPEKSSGDFRGLWPTLRPWRDVKLQGN